jgi:hypothetical protein
LVPVQYNTTTTGTSTGRWPLVLLLLLKYTVPARRSARALISSPQHLSSPAPTLFFISLHTRSEKNEKEREGEKRLKGLIVQTLLHKSGAAGLERELALAYCTCGKGSSSKKFLVKLLN